jgi:DNA-binding IclR family transcriptional regulator
MRPSKRSASQSGAPLGAVGRTFAVLDALAERRLVPFSELQQSCSGMAKATLARLLQSLTSAGMVEKNLMGGGYSLGPECFRFARAVLGVVSRGELVAPALTTLAHASGESAAYFEMDRGKMKLVNKAEMPNSFHYVPVGRRGGRLHIHVFALVVLAFSDDSVARRLLAGEKRADEAGRKRAAAACARIRAEGLHMGTESPGSSISRVVAPVFDCEGAVSGAIGITLLGRDTPKKRLAQCKQYVLEAAECAREGILRGASTHD